MALSPNADPGNENSVLRFHRVGHQHEATTALHDALSSLAGGETLDTAGRILIVSGQAGTGKTHLVVNELRHAPKSVLPIVIFSPDRWKEFDPWLDEQVVTSLLPNEADSKQADSLTTLSTVLIAAAFGKDPKNLERISKRLETDWGENPSREIFDSLRDAGRALIVNYVPVGALVDNALSAALGSRDKWLMQMAAAMRDQLKLSTIPDAEDFCAALLLCQTPFSQSAYHWLSQKSVPQDLLPKLRRNSSRFSTFRCIAKALAQQKRQVVLCFDQLERVALDAADGDSRALKQLIQESLQILRSQPNVACIVSALTDIVDGTMKILPQPDRDRVEQDPGIQSLRNLSLDEAMDFFAPRLAYIAEEYPIAAQEVSNFLTWVRSHSASRRVPPRLLLRGAMGAAKQALNGGALSANDFAAIWTETTKQLVTATPDISAPLKTEPEPVDVESEWHRIKSEGGELRFLPKTFQDVVDVIAWALPALAPAISGASAVTDVSHNLRKRPELDFAVTTAKGDKVVTRLFLLNEPNYRGKLSDQLKSLKSSKFAGRKIAFRTRDAFPMGPQSKLRPQIEELKAAGFLFVDMSASEIVTILQLRKLSAAVERPALERWLEKRLLPLPGLSALLTASRLAS